MFAVDAGSTQCLRRADDQEVQHLKGKDIKGGGYDLVPITLQLIKSGDLEFTIDQQPYLQGFYPVMQLFLYQDLRRPHCAVQHQHGPALHHQGQRGPVPRDEVALRGKR